MARRKAPQRTCQGASKGSLAMKASPQPAEKAAGSKAFQPENGNPPVKGFAQALACGQTQDSLFFRQKMASQKKGFLQVILLLAVALVGHYCGTSLPAWSKCAKGLVEVSDSAMRPLCGWRKPRSCSFCWRSCLSCGRRSAACRRQRPRWPQKTGPWKALVPPSTRRELRRPTAAERIRAAGLWRCSFHPNLLMPFC
ncbi:unnamed protein product, partial [Bubo scandiacus]